MPDLVPDSPRPFQLAQIQIFISEGDAPEVYRIRLDVGCHLLVVTTTGTITDGGLATCFQHLRMMQEFSDSYCVLLDTRQVDNSRLTALGVLKLAAASRNDKSKLAIVAPSGVVFGMARMYESRTNDKTERVAVFLKVEAAIQALASPDWYFSQGCTPESMLTRLLNDLQVG